MLDRLRRKGLSESRRRHVREYCFPYRKYWPDTLETPKSYSARLTVIAGRGWKAGRDAALSRRPPAVTR